MSADPGPVASSPLRGSPTPRKKRRGLLVAVLTVCLLLAALAVVKLRKGTAGAGGKAMAAAAGDRPVPVQIATVEKKDVPVHVDGLGTVVPLATVTVKSQVDGRLDQILFREGQQVKKGEVLAIVDPRAYQAQLHQSEAVLKKDEALLANGNLTLDRMKRLRGESLASQQELDDQKSQVAQLEAQLGADRALAESARLSVDFSRIKSPVDGVVGVRLVDQGNIVRAGDAQGIVVVTSLDPITVVFPVPQDAVPGIVLAKARGPLAVSVFARDGKEPLARGELLVVDNQIDPQTSMVKLKAQLPNPAHVLWPGAFVRARLELSVKKDAMVVPDGAIQHGPDGAFVYVVVSDSPQAGAAPRSGINDGDKVEMRPVITEPGDGEWVVVQKGLALGERVVTDGQSQLRVGAKVVPRGSHS